MFNNILEKAAKAAKDAARDVERELAKSVTPISSPISKAPSANDLAWLHRSPDSASPPKQHDFGSLHSPKQKAGTGVGRSASWSNFAEAFAPNSKTNSKPDLVSSSGNQGRPNDGRGRAAERNAEKFSRYINSGETTEHSPASRPRSRLGVPQLEGADGSSREERERQLDDAQTQIEIYEELTAKHNQDKIMFQDQIAQLKARNAQLAAEVQKTREDSDIELALATSKYESLERMLDSLKVKARRKLSLMQKEIDNLKLEKSSGKYNSNSTDNPSEEESSRSSPLISSIKTPSLSSLMSTVSLGEDNNDVLPEDLAQPRPEEESKLDEIDRPTKSTTSVPEHIELPETPKGAPEYTALEDGDANEGTGRSNQKSPPTSPRPTSVDRNGGGDLSNMLELRQAHDALLCDHKAAVTQLYALKKTYEEKEKYWHELEIKQLTESKARKSGVDSENEETERLMEALTKRIEELESNLKREKEKSSRVSASTPGGGKDGDKVTDDRNFKFEEQVKDLRFQLVSKQKEMAKIQESLTTTAADLEKTKTEHEEKMKRMKAIFTQANKTVNELRQQVAKKESDISGLQAELDDFKEQESRILLEKDESQRRTDMLTTELRAQEVMFNAKLERLEAQNRASAQKLSQVSTEFNQYKLRAHNLLQKNSGGSTEASKITELKEALDIAEQENREKMIQIQESDDRIQKLESGLNEMYNHISDLEKQLEAAKEVEAQKSRLENDKVLLEEQLWSERKGFKEALESSQLVNANAIRKEIERATTDMETRLHNKEEEHAALQNVTERLQVEHENVKKELENKVRDLEDLRRERNTVKQPTNQSMDIDGVEEGPANSGSSGISHVVSSPSVSANENALKGVTNATLEDLLANTRLPPHSATSVDLNSAFGSSAAPRISSTDFKERESQLKLQHMAELLNDSEASVQRLMDQEKMLKEEIRRLDRIDRRQDLNIEYLKNVLLKFIESTEREPLIPVLATVLHLSSEEVEKLKTSVASGGSATPTASTGLLPWIL